MFRCRWLLLCLPVAVYAQHPFEIQVFEYEPLPLGAYTYESHVNYVLDGIKTNDGPVAPEQDQIALQLGMDRRHHRSDSGWLGRVDGGGAGSRNTCAGVRVLPHFYAPRSWGLPVNLGFVAEFS